MAPTPEELVARIEALPEDMQKQVIDFIDYHLARLNQSGSLPSQGGVPGLAKGRITIADDFDPPLTDGGSLEK